MWYLEPADNDNDGNNENPWPYFYFPLRPVREVSIGRQKTDIKLDNTTVSRRHATLSTPDAAPKRSPCLLLKDTSSCGTFVNDENIQLLTEGRLVIANDRIYFGDHKLKKGVGYTLRCIELNVCFSTVSPDMKLQLTETVQGMSGTVHPDVVQNSTKYLVMPQITVTQKLIIALISQIHIVIPDFIADLHKSIENSSAPPIEKYYTPPIGESQLTTDVDLTPNIKRRSLFRGKTFFFLSLSDYNMHSFLVSSCFGTVARAHSPEALGNNSFSEEALMETSSVVIQSYNCKGRQKKSEWELRVYDLLRAAHRRPCYTLELFYAILYISVDRYCNPGKRCDLAIIGGNTNTQMTNSQTVRDMHSMSMSFADETQPLGDESSRSKRTLDACTTESSSTLCDESVFKEPPPKRPKTSLAAPKSSVDDNCTSGEVSSVSAVEDAVSSTHESRTPQIVSSHSLAAEAMDDDSAEQDLFRSLSFPDPIAESGTISAEPAKPQTASPSRKKPYKLLPSDQRRSLYPSPEKSGRPSDNTSPFPQVSKVGSPSRKSPARCANLIAPPPKLTLENIGQHSTAKTVVKLMPNLLVTKTAETTKSKSQIEVTAGHSLWNGKMVRNFKRFRPKSKRGHDQSTTDASNTLRDKTSTSFHAQFVPYSRPDPLSSEDVKDEVDAKKKVQLQLFDELIF